MMLGKSAEDNPYESPPTDPEPIPADQLPNLTSPWRWALSGAIWSVLSTFPIVGITAFLFRFPIPFMGYLSGINAVLPSMIAVFFYGVLFGGLLLLGGLGATGGFIAAITLKHDERRCKMATRLWSLVVTTTGVLTLAVLDKIIGPW